MNQLLGDTLFNVACVVLVSTFIGGWILLIAVMLVQKLFPAVESRAENFLQKISKPIGQIQKYVFIMMIVLLLLRFFAGLLGWAPPLEYGPAQETYMGR